MKKLFYIGTIVAGGKYRLDEMLGRGGFSEVWKATYMPTGEVLALKLLAPDGGMEDTDRALFKNEYLLLRDMQHHHLLRAEHYDEFEYEGETFTFLKMRYFAQGNLRKWMLTNNFHGRNTTEELLARVMNEVCQGLAYLHKADRTHNDIKPANILVSDQREFVLADFGIATQVRATLTQLTRRRAVELATAEADGGSPRTSGTSGATIGYDPPELYSSLPIRTPAADIFALGCTLVEVATGQLPFNGEGGRILAAYDLPAPDLHAMHADRFSPQFAALVKRCLAKQPEDRPTAKELEQQAAFFLQEGTWPVVKTVTAPPPVTTSTPPPKTSPKPKPGGSQVTTKVGNGQADTLELSESPARSLPINGQMLGIVAAAVVVFGLLVGGIWWGYTWWQSRPVEPEEPEVEKTDSLKTDQKGPDIVLDTAKKTPTGTENTQPVVEKPQPKPVEEKPKPEPVVVKPQPKPEPVVEKPQPRPTPTGQRPDYIVALEADLKSLKDDISKQGAISKQFAANAKIVDTQGKQFEDVEDFLSHVSFCYFVQIVDFEPKTSGAITYLKVRTQGCK
ncbi:MAG: protein kinase [Bernardetiaceae bacterium]|jgi:serine/threonine protein kinase|nr:protein kinase [Bernardetiaceae bacterium]